MNTFMNSLEDAMNFTYTENGALTHVTTRSNLLDLFALGGAYRSRSDEDVINLFQKAFYEEPLYALKCVFYLRDILEGQGERRFFRVAMKWLANYNTKVVVRNLSSFPRLGRWDDLYCLVDTPAEAEMFKFIKHQLVLDMQCKTPSLLAKWLKSENASSSETKRLGRKTREAMGMTARQYRKTLSILRERINVLERLMSAGKWDEIEFDKIPSRAGMIYRNAFARHDVERMKSEKAVQSYEDFAKDTTKTVNAKALYPYECVAQAIKSMRWAGVWSHREIEGLPMDATERLMINKYWNNLTDYFNNATFNGIAVVDTSGSMTSSYRSTVAPIDVAISLGLYCAEHNSGPFANKYISFASRPQLINTDGVDFYDKVRRIYQTNLVDNTNIEAVFDLLLNVALKNRVNKNDIPKNIIIISDMEFDSAQGWGHKGWNKTLMENIKSEWENYGLVMPNLIFWNVNARQDNIPMKVEQGVTFVSGFSPSIFESIMSGKTAEDLMFEVLDKQRYAEIH